MKRPLNSYYNFYGHLVYGWAYFFDFVPVFELGLIVACTSVENPLFTHCNFLRKALITKLGPIYNNTRGIFVSIFCLLGTKHCLRTMSGVAETYELW